MVNFIYTINSEAEEPIMLINKHIGFDADLGMGISGSQFQSELFALDSMGKNRIKVYMNTPGGSVIEGMSIYSAILNTKTSVDTYCMGICASIGMPIFQAGKKRYMSDFGALMVHNPFYSSNPADKDQITDVMRDSISKMISQRTGISDWETKVAMDVETWYTPQPMADGSYPVSPFWDEVIPSNSKNKPRLNKTDVMATFKDFSKYVNSLITNKSTMNLTEVCNSLGINENSNEKTIVKAINEALNKKDIEIQKITEAHNSLLKDLDSTKAQLKDALDIADTYKAQAEAKEKEALASKISNVLDKYKHVVNDTNREFWTKSLTENFDGAESALKQIPIVQNGVNIQVDTVTAGALTPEKRLEEMRAKLRRGEKI